LTKGYNNKILRVNLTQNSCSLETPTDEFERKFIGGAGFGTYYLFKETKPGIDPLGPENKIMFMAGPSLAILLRSSRNAVVTKSP